MKKKISKKRSFIICTLRRIVLKAIKSTKLRWTDHAARIGGDNNAHNIWSENLKGRDQVVNPGVYERITLRWILYI
jgi:hypothetical protein